MLSISMLSFPFKKEQQSPPVKLSYIFLQTAGIALRLRLKSIFLILRPDSGKKIMDKSPQFPGAILPWIGIIVGIAPPKLTLQFLEKVNSRQLMSLKQ